jgi:uncharacterized membrane protein
MTTARALAFALALSLTVNAFLGAFAVAVMVAPGLIAHGPATPALRKAARALDPPHRAALIAILRADGRRLRPQTQQVRILRREVWTAFEARTFDPAAAKAKLAQARALGAEASHEVEEDVVDFAATLPAGQRAALGEALLRLTRPVRRPLVSPASSGPASPAPGSSPAPRSPG